MSFISRFFRNEILRPHGQHGANSSDGSSSADGWVGGGSSSADGSSSSDGWSDGTSSGDGASSGDSWLA